MKIDQSSYSKKGRSLSDPPKSIIEEEKIPNDYVKMSMI